MTKKLKQKKDHLSELDGPIGDGDHGANLARGMAAAIEAINTTEPKVQQKFLRRRQWP